MTNPNPNPNHNSTPYPAPPPRCDGQEYEGEWQCFTPVADIAVLIAVYATTQDVSLCAWQARAWVWLSLLTAVYQLAEVLSPPPPVHPSGVRCT